MNVSQSGERSVAEAVCVVLSRTTHPGNIGAVARAMKNMGLVHLRLVDPSPAKEVLDNGSEIELSPQQSHEAVRRSSGAQDLLENCQTFSSMEEALADCQLIVGASARTRKMNWPLINPRQAAQVVIEHVLGVSPSKVALVFGNEASGLSNEELQLCHYHVNIPAVESFASLNLAMAVQLICYEVRMALLSYPIENKTKNSEFEALELQVNAPISSCSGEEGEEVRELASFKELDGLLSHLEETLIKIGYLDVDNPRQLMPKLRRLYSRARLEKVEINILRGILKATQNYKL